MHVREIPAFISTQVHRGTYLIPGAEADGSCELGVVCAGWESCASDYRIARTNFPYHALEFIAGGEWELELEGVKRRLTPGAVFSYGPEVAYRLRPLGGAGLSKYFVDLGGREAAERLKAAQLSPGSEGMVLQHRWLRELFDQLIETRHFEAAAQRRISRMTLELLLERLPQHLSEDEQKTQAWLSFERCRDYLSENYLSLVSLSGAAEACSVSPAYLSRLFRRFSNESPKAFLDRMKMNHAAQKLLRGNLQVKRVAAEIGFADVFHFSRVFKKCFGVPPSVFAQKQRRD